MLEGGGRRAEQGCPRSQAGCKDLSMLSLSDASLHLHNLLQINRFNRPRARCGGSTRRARFGLVSFYKVT